MADVMKRVKKEVKSDKKKSKSADKKPNTQAIRRKKYSRILKDMQEGTQNYKVLSLLIRKGSTTTLDIINEYTILNPTARITDLRQLYCLPITTTLVTKKRDDGTSVRYGKFTLEV